jgi:hypothetical protein
LVTPFVRAPTAVDHCSIIFALAAAPPLLKQKNNRKISFH